MTGSDGSADGSVTGGNTSADFRVQRADGGARRDALAVMLTGVANGEGQAVDQFLHFADQKNLSMDELWMAERDGRPVASVLVMPNPGRTAMIFVSPVRSDVDLKAVSLAAGRACQGQDGRKLRLVQALLEPSQQMERKALLAAGFIDLAELLYMRRKVRGAGAPMQLDSSIEVRHWSRQDQQLFADATVASYEQTLDCPGLKGLRHIDDIIAGHMASGQFHPELWFALRCGDEPVGVMLLNIVPQHCSVELVYLGLTVPWRGRGLGRRLLLHGLLVAQGYDAEQMILAVDRINTPAVALYRSIGFTQSARKLAMLFTLPSL